MAISTCARCMRALLLPIADESSYSRKFSLLRSGNQPMHTRKFALINSGKLLASEYIAKISDK